MPKSEGFVDIAKRHGFADITEEKLNQVTAPFKFQVAIVPRCASYIILILQINTNVEKHEISRNHGSIPLTWSYYNHVGMT